MLQLVDMNNLALFTIVDLDICLTLDFRHVG